MDRSCGKHFFLELPIGLFTLAQDQGCCQGGLAKDHMLVDCMECSMGPTS